MVQWARVEEIRRLHDEHIAADEACADDAADDDTRALRDRLAQQLTVLAIWIQPVHKSA